MLNCHNNPLVSVVIITYNSSKTVLETLESVKDQTYQNIELIVTDDCSTDNTLETVIDWINDNRLRFVRTEIVTTEKNTGVSGNNNRGVSKSHGEWIKLLAGDDCLVPTCIEEFVAFVTSQKDMVRICISDVEPFCENGEVPKSVIERYNSIFELEKESYQRQRIMVMTGVIFAGTAIFFTKELFTEVGGFSEEYGNAEEWAFFYKVIMGGNRIFALQKKLVRYRFSDSSLCHIRDDKGLVNRSVFKGAYRHFFDHAFKDLIRDGQLLLAWHHALSYWGRNIQYHINNRTLRIIVEKGALVLSPLTYLIKLGIVTPDGQCHNKKYHD